MQTLGVIEPVLLVIAGFSRHETLLDEITVELESLFGPVAVAGPTIEFRNTAYYEASMGRGLLKRYWAFERLQEPDALAAVKRKTIAVEEALQLSGRFPEARPLNLDPGFLGLGKFVLATTKDQAHRVYLHGGIFAEVTLRYHDGEYEPRPWTYPDWQLPQVIAFLKEARRYFASVRVEHAGHRRQLPDLLVRQTSNR